MVILLCNLSSCVPFTSKNDEWVACIDRVKEAFSSLQEPLFGKLAIVGDNIGFGIDYDYQGNLKVR